MDKKRILLLGAMGILLAAAIALGAVWIMEAAEYAGYKADYVDIAEDVLHSDEDDGIILDDEEEVILPDDEIAIPVE